MKKIAILTGATGGLGHAFLAQLINEDLDEIWAVARSQQKLDNLRSTYGAKILPISADLSAPQGIAQVRDMLQEQRPFVSYLINNAGMARMGRYDDFSLEEISKTIDLNCKAPVLLAQICIPHMGQGSKILNISSASSFQPNPYINLYAASKVFERSYSRALNVELEGTGISSVVVCPGWIDTEMLQKEIDGKPVRFPGLVSPDRVAKQAIRDAKKGKDMSVCSLYVKYLHVNSKMTPQRWIMKIWMTGIGKYLKRSAT